MVDVSPQVRGRYTLVVVGTLLTLALAGCTDDPTPRVEARSSGAIGLDVLPSISQGCDVVARDVRERTTTGLVIVADVVIKGARTAEDRWTGHASMRWDTAPAAVPTVPPSSNTLPQDQYVRKNWTSPAGDDNRLLDEMRMVWSAEAFPDEGAYSGYLTLTMVQETRNEDGTWRQLCEQGETVRVEAQVV